MQPKLMWQTPFLIDLTAMGNTYSGQSIGYIEQHCVVSPGTSSISPYWAPTTSGEVLNDTICGWIPR